MTPNMNTFATENWAKTSRELISQTRSLAVTMRGITLGTWQGFNNLGPINENAQPWTEMVTAAHEHWLDLWENQANALIDTVNVGEPIKKK